MSSSQNYAGNPQLKKAYVDIEWTPELLEEYLKCSKDPVYFAKKYIKIISVDEGVVPFNLYKFQEKLIKTFHKNRFNICKLPRQSGKCCETNTIIKVRNKDTGEILELTIGEFYEKIKEKDDSNLP